MWRPGRLLFGAVLLVSSAGGADAQSAAPLPGDTTPGVVVEGSPDVLIGNTPAARRGDQTSHSSPLVEGSPDVFINDHPAVTLGGRSGCGAVVVSGASNIFINGKAVARLGDTTAGCAQNR